MSALDRDRSAINDGSAPTWKDAHDALSQYVTTLMVTEAPEETRDAAFDRYTAIYGAVRDAENGSEVAP